MKGSHYKKLLSCALVALVILSSPASSVLSQQPPVGVSGGVVDLQALAGYTFNYRLLKQTVALWSDGRGDVILERTLRNVDISNWPATTWYFDWYSGNYSQIRAWDDSGPLTYSTVRSGTRIYITVNFRRPIQPSESYHFFLAITIGNMASVSGNSGHAYWYTYPGSPVQEFIQGVTFPSNSTFQSISPAPTTQRLNYLEWHYTNTSANWQQTIDVYYALSSSIAVPLLLQTNRWIQPPQPRQSWQDDPYGHPVRGQGLTVGGYGCYMTSAAMIINYWGQRIQPPFQTDPGIFNSWLRNHNGYNEDSEVLPGPVLQYAKDNGVTLTNPSPNILWGRNSTNDVIVDSYLLSGNPVIMGVNEKISPDGRHYAGHYVVATGKTTINGTPTYTINDPIYGQTTLYNQWNDTYFSVRLFSGTSADQRSIRISAHSPVELFITDPQGRRLGYDPITGAFLNEIPDSEYFIESIVADGIGSEQLPISKAAEIHTPIDGQYSVAVVSTGVGAYTINITASSWLASVSQQTITGIAQAGSVDTQDLNYSSYTGVNPPLNAPFLLSPGNNELIMSYTPELDWNNATPAPDHYQVQLSTDNDFSKVVRDEIVTDSAYTPSVPLDSNTLYYWRVRSVDAIGQFSVWSEVQNFRIAFLAPASFSPGGLSQPSTTRPLFDWGNVGGASSYNLQISINQNFTTLVLNLNVTPSAYMPTADLPKGALLFWRARANGTNGPSAWSRVRHFDSPNPPSVPTPLLPANNAATTGKPTLDWSDSAPGLDHYEVQLSTSATFATVLGRGQGGRTAFSQYTVETALATNTTYYWRVRAVNTAGQFSNWPSNRSFRVP